MALKPCRKCKKEVSTSDKNCQHCGIQKPAASNGEIFFGGLILALIIFFVFNSFTNDDKKEEQAKDQPATVQDAAPAKISSTPEEKLPTKNIGMSPDEFRKNYNNMVGQVDKAWRIAEFEISEGHTNNSIKASLSKAVHVLGAVDKKSGNIIDLLVFVGGGKPEDNLQAIVSMLSVAHATTQGATKDEISNTVSSSMQKAIESMGHPDAKPVVVVVGNRKYSFSASEPTGLVFSISDASK